MSVISDIYTLVTDPVFAELRGETVVASGGFDPIHIGHVRYLREAAELGQLIVIVNTDEFLINKKGKPFMPLKERMEIVDAVKGVKIVTSWHEENQSVCGALELIKPTYFVKGGDRTIDNIPEKTTCNELNIQMIFNTGGSKIQSSSWLINDIRTSD